MMLLCLGLAYFADSAGGASWYSILPPLFAISLAFLTQRIFLSLILAIVIGSFLHFVPTGVGEIGNYGRAVIYPVSLAWQSITDIENLKVLGFVFVLLMAISVIIVSGGIAAMVESMQKHISSRKSSQVVTVIMGFLVFIDDYANTMIVGASMRGFTDRYKVSREKLAFFVDATSAPVAGLAIVSTWIGYEVGLFEEISKEYSLSADGYGLFFEALSSRFYCWFMLIFVFANAILSRDFGLMARAEHRAFHKGEVSRKGAKLSATTSFEQIEPAMEVKHHLMTALLPLLSLLSFVFLAMFYDGGGFNNGFLGLFSFGTWFEALKSSSNGVMILFYGACLCLVLAILCSQFLAKLPGKLLGISLYKGLKGALLPTGILVLAWSLKVICDDLQTGLFLTESIGRHISASVLPLIVFLISAATAFATGTSFGTMAILIPTITPLALHLQGGNEGILLAICLAAILDGAIMGAHCSPISDTTIMSSIASQCDLMDHVKTQMPYSLLVGAVALVFGYLPATLELPTWLQYGLAGLCLVAVLRFLGRKVENPGPIKAD